MNIIYFEKKTLSLTEASIKKNYTIIPSPEIKSKNTCVWLRVVFRKITTYSCNFSNAFSPRYRSLLIFPRFIVNSQNPCFRTV